MSKTDFFFRGHIKTFKYAKIYNIMQMGASQPSTTIIEYDNMEKDTTVEKEQKVVNVLQHLGFSMPEAQTLIFLFKTDRVTARDIERGTKLRQPEVSMGTSALVNRKWVKTSEIQTKGKGRPHYRYYLARPKKEIIDDILEEIRKKIEQEQQNLTIIRELLL